MARSHARRGRRWEDLLDHWCALYMRRGDCYVVRTPPSVRVLSRVQRGQFRACFAGAGPVDYHAVVDGVAIAAEAKSVQGSRLPYSVLEEHQARQLDQHNAAGGVSLLWVDLAGDRRALRWRDVAGDWWAWHGRPGRSAPGTASLSGKAYQALGERIDDAGWLSAVRRLLNQRPQGGQGGQE